MPAPDYSASGCNASRRCPGATTATPRWRCGYRVRCLIQPTKLAIRGSPKAKRPYAVSQANGVDLDAFVDVAIALRAGIQPDDRVFMRALHEKRLLSALVLLDLSASTIERHTRIGVALRHATRRLADDPGRRPCVLCCSRPSGGRLRAHDFPGKQLSGDGRDGGLAVETAWLVFAADTAKPKPGAQKQVPACAGTCFLAGGVDGTRTRDPRRDRPVF